MQQAEGSIVLSALLVCMFTSCRAPASLLGPESDVECDVRDSHLRITLANKPL